MSEAFREQRAGTAVTIDIRRHAERAHGPDSGRSLSAAGLAMARRLRPLGDGFARVISSPRERARDTALAMADRVDELATILDVSPDDVLTQTQYDTLRSQEAVAGLLRTSGPTDRFAEDQLSFWQSVARRLANGESALLVTHGGNVELAAVRLAARLGSRVDPLPLSFCEGVRVRFEQSEPVALERLSAG